MFANTWKRIWCPLRTAQTIVSIWLSLIPPGQPTPTAEGTIRWTRHYVHRLFCGWQLQLQAAVRPRGDVVGTARTSYVILRNEHCTTYV